MDGEFLQDINHEAQLYHHLTLLIQIFNQLLQLTHHTLERFHKQISQPHKLIHLHRIIDNSIPLIEQYNY